MRATFGGSRIKNICLTLMKTSSFLLTVAIASASLSLRAAETSTSFEDLQTVRDFQNRYTSGKLKTLEDFENRYPAGSPTPYRDFLSHQEVMKEGPAVAALGEMTQRMTAQILDNPYKFEVTVVKSDVVNAFALPGGYVVVFTGLMKKAESGEEVAGVLSHELNHVLQRHGLERIVKSLGLMTVAAIVFGNQQGLVGMMKQLGVELFTLKFGREQETEADLRGLQLLQRAKIDPSGMITFFERLSEKDQGRMEWLSTHPMSAARAERLKAELAALPKKLSEPFTFDWKQVQASIGSQTVVVP